MMDLSEKEAQSIDEFVTEKSLISPVITAQNLCSINSCPDQQMYRARILFLFQLDAYVQDENGEADPAALEALIDLVHDAIVFASDTQIPYAKSIVFLTIFIVVIQQAIMDPIYDPERLYRRYERFLLIHSVERPPFSSAIFELPDIKIIHEFFVNHVFRHLKLIIACLTPKQILSFKTLNGVKIPLPELPPLSKMEMEIQEQLVPPPQFSDSPLSAEYSKPDTANKEEHEKVERPSSKLTKNASQRSASSSKQNTAGNSRPLSGVPNEQTTPDSTEQPDNKGPEVPLDALQNTLVQMHQKFVSDFDDKERLLMGKIKELEIRYNEKQQLTPKKTPMKQSKK